MGFGAKWVDLVQRCLSSVSFGFLVNGRQWGYVKTKSDLRQGDLISSCYVRRCSTICLPQLVLKEKFKGLQSTKMLLE